MEQQCIGLLSTNIQNNGTLTPRHKAQNSLIGQLGASYRSKTILGNSKIQNSQNSKQKKGECVITYNFDNNNNSNSVTHNIFIGWDEEPTKKSIKKMVKPQSNYSIFNSKFSNKNKRLVNRIVSEIQENQKQNTGADAQTCQQDRDKTKRLTESKVQKQRLYGCQNAMCSNSRVHKSKEPSTYNNKQINRKNTQKEPTHMPYIQRNKKYQIKLPHQQNHNRNSSYNTLKPIQNPIQKTIRKSQNQYFDKQSTVKIGKNGKFNEKDRNQGSFSNIQSSRRVKLESFSENKNIRTDTNRLASIDQTKNRYFPEKQQYRNGRTIESKKIPKISTKNQQKQTKQQKQSIPNTLSSKPPKNQPLTKQFSPRYLSPHKMTSPSLQNNQKQKSNSKQKELKSKKIFNTQDQRLWKRNHSNRNSQGSNVQGQKQSLGGKSRIGEGSKEEDGANFCDYGDDTLKLIEELQRMEQESSRVTDNKQLKQRIRGMDSNNNSQHHEKTNSNMNSKSFNKRNKLNQTNKSKIQDDLIKDISQNHSKMDGYKKNKSSSEHLQLKKFNKKENRDKNEKDNMKQGDRSLSNQLKYETKQKSINQGNSSNKNKYHLDIAKKPSQSKKLNQKNTNNQQFVKNVQKKNITNNEDKKTTKQDQKISKNKKYEQKSKVKEQSKSKTKNEKIQNKNNSTNKGNKIDESKIQKSRNNLSLSTSKDKQNILDKSKSNIQNEQLNNTNGSKIQNNYSLTENANNVSINHKQQVLDENKGQGKNKEDKNDHNNQNDDNKNQPMKLSKRIEHCPLQQSRQKQQTVRYLKKDIIKPQISFVEEKNSKQVIEETQNQGKEIHKQKTLNNSTNGLETEDNKSKQQTKAIKFKEQVKDPKQSKAVSLASKKSIQQGSRKQLKAPDQHKSIQSHKSITNGKKNIDNKKNNIEQIKLNKSQKKIEKQLEKDQRKFKEQEKKDECQQTVQMLSPRSLQLKSKQINLKIASNLAKDSTKQIMSFKNIEKKQKDDEKNKGSIKVIQGTKIQDKLQEKEKKSQKQITKIQQQKQKTNKHEHKLKGQIKKCEEVEQKLSKKQKNQSRNTNRSANSSKHTHEDLKKSNKNIDVSKSFAEQQNKKEIKSSNKQQSQILKNGENDQGSSKKIREASQIDQKQNKRPQSKDCKQVKKTHSGAAIFRKKSELPQSKKNESQRSNRANQQQKTKGGENNCKQSKNANQLKKQNEKELKKDNERKLSKRQQRLSSRQSNKQRPIKSKINKSEKQNVERKEEVNFQQQKKQEKQNQNKKKQQNIQKSKKKNENYPLKDENSKKIVVPIKNLNQGDQQTSRSSKLQNKNQEKQQLKKTKETPNIKNNESAHKNSKPKVVPNSGSLSRNSYAQSDSDLETTPNIANSQAPKQITCISKRSSQRSNVPERLSKRQQAKPNIVKQFKNASVQMGADELKKALNTNLNQLKRQQPQDNIFSFANISCQPKLQANQKQSFLDISNDQLNHTDFPESPKLIQRKFNNSNAISPNKSKNKTHFNHAPILSYIYGDERKEVQKILKKLIKSEQRNSLSFMEDYSKNQYEQEEIFKNDSVYKAIKIVLEIDPWLLDRIIQPYFTEEGAGHIWLYCKGHWKLFCCQSSVSAINFVRQAIDQALVQHYKEQDSNKIGVQQILRMITGLQILHLKNKKKLSQQLQHQLKKGNIIKGLSTQPSKPIYTITAVQQTKNKQKLIRIQSKSKNTNTNTDTNDDNLLWVRQDTFEKYFQYFLLICYREENYWNSRVLKEVVEGETLVFTMDSLRNVVGSVQVHVEGEVGCKMDLYREVKPRVLKFIGSVNEKNKPIRSVQNPNPSLYFNFSLKGRYYLMLTLTNLHPSSSPRTSSHPTPHISIQSGSSIMLSYLQSIQHQTLKNKKSEYLQIDNKSLSSINNNGHTFKNLNTSIHSSKSKSQNKNKDKDKDKDKEGDGEDMGKDKIREQFIRYLIDGAKKE